MLLFYLFILLVSFYLLAKICDEYFVESLEEISTILNLPSEAAGATLMAMGSSAPELFIAIIALVKNGGTHADLGVGTIVGSALFNILVIIGASAMVRTSKLTWQPVVRDSLFYSISILLLLVSFRDGSINQLEALSFVSLYIIYIIAVLYWRKLFPYKEKGADLISEVEKEFESLEKKKNLFTTITKPLDLLLKQIFRFVKNTWCIFSLSIAIIAILSWVLVESAIALATILSIPESIIALTILAAGTSVPDLFSSVIVAKRGKGDMAISNAVGSNIFDILIGLGLVWFISLSLTETNVIAVDVHNLTSSVILLFATVVATLFIYISNKWKIGRKSGLLLMLAYAGYLIFAISRVV